MGCGGWTHSGLGLGDDRLHSAGRQEVLEGLRRVLGEVADSEALPRQGLHAVPHRAVGIWPDAGLEDLKSTESGFRTRTLSHYVTYTEAEMLYNKKCPEHSLSLSEDIHWHSQRYTTKFVQPRYSRCCTS